ncbi:hypothetical protein T05_12474 [Trichinella murrelli]|uniref:Uncharacterized protein n=1 Tax=Trichinella murrelli TaxID=144512 RepID=A0A0V0T745_9BILA|nr:hypothetical protein T05_12474 [Trichinella murrelli]
MNHRSTFEDRASGGVIQRGLSDIRPRSPIVAPSGARFIRDIYDTKNFVELPARSRTHHSYQPVGGSPPDREGRRRMWISLEGRGSRGLHVLTYNGVFRDNLLPFFSREHRYGERTTPLSFSTASGRELMACRGFHLHKWGGMPLEDAGNLLGTLNTT